MFDDVFEYLNLFAIIFGQLGYICYTLLTLLRAKRGCNVDIEEEKALFWHWIVQIFNNKKGSPDKVSFGERI